MKSIMPIALLILIVGGAYFLFSSNSNSNVDTVDTPAVVIDEDSLDTQAVQEQGSIEMDSSISAEKYVMYTPTVVQEILDAGKTPVLFFHAAWCPTCRALVNELEAGGLNQIPDSVVIIQTDYDTQQELKKQYGITIQHTLVQLDANQESVSKWTGGDVDTILDNLVL